MSSTWDYAELAARSLGLSELEYEKLENNGDSFEIVEDLLFDKLDVTFEQFCNVVRVLLPMTLKVETAIQKDLKHVMGVYDSIGFRSIVDVDAVRIDK